MRDRGPSYDGSDSVFSVGTAPHSAVVLLRLRIVCDLTRLTLLLLKLHLALSQWLFLSLLLLFLLLLSSLVTLLVTAREVNHASIVLHGLF